jgi:hypothetical protein
MITMTSTTDTAGRSDELAELRDKLTQLEAEQHKGRRGRRRSALLIVAGVVTVATTAGAVAYASIPSSDNMVTACVTSATGSARIIDTDAGQTCLATETKVQWGGGMRFVGKWSTKGSWPKDASGNLVIKKGDVMYYDGTTNAVGCTSPKGSWVNVGGVNAYPCLETPYNWTPLALDGATGATGATGPAGPTGPQGPAGQSNTHWATFNGNSLTASSDGAADTYPYYAGTGRMYLYFGRIADSSKCAVNVSAADPTGYSQPVFATFARYYGWIYVETSKVSSGGTQYVDTETDVTLSCPTS